MKGRVATENDYSPMVSEDEREGKNEYDAEEMSTATESEQKLGETWKKIHGEDNWDGILEPIDPLLQSELIHHGEMAQVCYDAFDLDPYSRYCGSCKIRPSMFFQGPGWTQHRYEVVHYIYAMHNANLPQLFTTSLQSNGWSPTENWIGYVAVSNDESSAYLRHRDITITWRGAVTSLEWIANTKDVLHPISFHKIPNPGPMVKVQSGLLHVYTDKEDSCQFCRHSPREQILAQVKQLIQHYANEELSITITGHSLGSSLALLNVYDIAVTGANVMEDGRDVPICVFTFSGPRVGIVKFRDRLDELGVKLLRVVNVHDKVPMIPGIIFNEHVPSVVQKLIERSPWCYLHVGVEFALDHNKSPFLKETSDPVCIHNLEGLLHLIDGYHSKDSKHRLASRRDIALVYKACDFLKDHFLLPPNWWQTENRGFIRDTAGHWMQPDRHDLGDH